MCGLCGTVEVTLQIPKRLATLRHCLLFYRGFSTFVLSRKCDARPLWMPLLLCTGRLAVDTAHRPRAGLSVCVSVAALFFPLVLAPHMHSAAPLVLAPHDMHSAAPLVLAPHDMHSAAPLDLAPHDMHSAAPLVLAPHMHRATPLVLAPHDMHSAALLVLAPHMKCTALSRWS